MSRDAPISYLSTRGQAPRASFAEAVLAGLAPDGGLYLPERLPRFSPETLAGWQGLSYPALATEMLWPFVAEVFAGKAELRAMLDAAYADFRHAATAPLVQLDSRHFVLELFHGPTLAFKDFALQFLGRLMDRLLEKQGRGLTIIGATSGDTGSAAIAGFAGRDHMQIVILHPKGRTSEMQRLQMTTTGAQNVHNIAIEGDFDDCQAIVKTLLGDSELRKERPLGAVNSINWARVLAQTVYYAYAALALGAPARELAFSVPTGNFGDIYAGWLAMRMGVPIRRLIVASNRNDILTRCLRSGEYAAQGVSPSHSPSMDIQVSSNFERLLFDLSGGDGALVAGLMAQFAGEKRFTLNRPMHESLSRSFGARSCDDDATLAEIRHWHDATGYLADPHTAVGLAAARLEAGALPSHLPIVTLATAHPAKFEDAVRQATGQTPPSPPPLLDLRGRPERLTVLPASAQAVRNFLKELPA